MPSQIEEMLAKLQQMPEDERAALEEQVLEGTKDEIWMPNLGPQSDAYFSPADLLLYGGQGGGGKGLLPTENVITPFGMRPIGELRVGDTILSADGTGTCVIGVYPQPKQAVYRVTFADGESIVTDGPHRWNYSVSGQRWRKSGRKWKVGTTEQLKEMIDGGRRIQIPVCSPLKFTKTYKANMRVIDAYALGLLLGDGYTAQSGPGAKWSFASADPSLIAALPGDWVQDDGVNYRLRGPMRKELQAEFKRLGLSGCKSHTKFVPGPYKWADVTSRWALLQGLMDTDGTISSDGKAYFTSCSQQLAADVAWLVRSLGGRATMTSRIPTCTNGAAGPVAGAEAWTLYIRMPDNADLFRLPRKRARAKPAKSVKRRVVSVEHEGEAPTVCIAVDHPDSLYVAGEAMIVTHNTDLITGLALTQHQRSLIMRPQYVDLGAIIDRSVAIAGGRAGLNASPPAQFKYDGRIVDYGGANTLEKAETWQGNAHDLLAFDEACQFIESVVRFLMGWNRAAEEELGQESGQRVRSIMASNPPLSAAGEWIIGMFRPWLDLTHPLHGKIGHGELVWYITDPDGKDLEVDGSDDVREYTDGKGVTKQYIPKSRTFIPAALEDNPFLLNTDYQATLDAMPEPIRSAIRDGNFMAAREDDAYQVIPSAWVLAANERWRACDKPNVAMTSLGLDVARGGRDDTVFTPRWGTYFGEQTVVPGRRTPDGPSVAVLAAGMLREGAVVGVDNIGVGADAETALKNANLPYECMNGAEAATAHTRDGAFGFATKRSEMWWMLREALDPEYGFNLALPPDQGLMADLTTPTYEVRPGQPPKIYVESTKDMIKRLGRSPDKGSSVVYAWNAGDMELPGSPQRGKLLHAPAPQTEYDAKRL